jgi:hypothetical protein
VIKVSVDTATPRGAPSDTEDDEDDDDDDDGGGGGSSETDSSDGDDGDGNGNGNGKRKRATRARRNTNRNVKKPKKKKKQKKQKTPATAPARARWYLFRAWGRTGTNTGGQKLESGLGGRAATVARFWDLYREKTGNSWGDRNPTKKPRCFFPVEVSYDPEPQSQPSNSSAAAAGSAAGGKDLGDGSTTEMVAAGSKTKLPGAGFRLLCCSGRAQACACMCLLACV